MTSYVYKITNTINGKYYIGKTVNPDNRWSKHLSISKCGKRGDGYFSHIHAAIKKYGVENFSFTIIKSFDSELESLAFEIQLISEAKLNYNAIYNITNGGDGVSGYRHTAESKNKNSESHMGTKHPNYGKNLSVDTRVLISRNIGSRILSEENVQFIRSELFNGTTQKELANKFGVSQSLISKIKNGKNHKLV